MPFLYMYIFSSQPGPAQFIILPKAKNKFGVPTDSNLAPLDQLRGTQPLGHMKVFVFVIPINI